MIIAEKIKFILEQLHYLYDKWTGTRKVIYFPSVEVHNYCGLDLTVYGVFINCNPEERFGAWEARILSVVSGTKDKREFALIDDTMVDLVYEALRKRHCNRKDDDPGLKAAIKSYCKNSVSKPFTLDDLYVVDTRYISAVRALIADLVDEKLHNDFIPYEDRVKYVSAMYPEEVLPFINFSEPLKNGENPTYDPVQRARGPKGRSGVDDCELYPFFLVSDSGDVFVVDPEDNNKMYTPDCSLDDEITNIRYVDLHEVSVYSASPLDFLTTYRLLDNGTIRKVDLKVSVYLDALFGKNNYAVNKVETTEKHTVVTARKRDSRECVTVSSTKNEDYEDYTESGLEYRFFLSDES